MLNHVARFAVLFCVFARGASAGEPAAPPYGAYGEWKPEKAARFQPHPVADDDTNSPVTHLEAPARRAVELIAGGGLSAPECSAPWGTTCLMAGSSANASLAFLTRPGDRWAWGVQGVVTPHVAWTAEERATLAFLGLVARFELADAGSIEPYVEAAIGASAAVSKFASLADQIGPGFRGAIGIDWRVTSALRAGPSFGIMESLLAVPDACGEGCAATERRTTFTLDLRISWALGERL